VISKEDKEILYSLSPYNLVRIINGEELPGDDSKNNKYTRAAQFFQNWKEDQVLIPHKNHHIYVYEQEYFLPNGEKRIRKGFIALMKLEPFNHGNIRPHEKTMKGPSEDRYRLLDACKANFGQIFALFSDPHGVISQIMENAAKTTPSGELVDWENTRHRFWHVHDSKLVSRIQQEMLDEVVYIADGHHRYETALRYMLHEKERTSRWTGEEPWNFRLTTFIKMDEGVTILPAHRLVRGLGEIDSTWLESELLKYFDLTIFQFGREDEVRQRQKMALLLEESQGKHALGLSIRKANRCYLMRLKDQSVIDKEIDRNHCMAWRRLDTTILHSLLLGKVLGVQEAEQHVSYVKGDVETTVQRMYMEDFDAAIFLNPTTVQEVKDVADAGERMPEKSTYFFPKIISGLVIYGFD